MLRDEVRATLGVTTLYWFKRVMFDRAWLGTPSVHRARAADLAGW